MKEILLSNGGVALTNGTTSVPIILVPQTGMPAIHTSRSRELIYDALDGNIRFVKNPFGPQELPLSRSNHHW